MWEKMYKMKLGETLQELPNNYEMHRLTRVPGGWIYIYGINQIMTSSFIPMDNEFQDVTWG